MFKLYPSEELIIETETNPTIDERKKSRYLLIMGLILVFTGLFYRYASAQDWVLSIIFWVSIIGVVISLSAYIFKIYDAGKLKGSKKYYLTSSRVVETDANGKVKKEILLSKIKRVELIKIVGKAGDVVINPKPQSPQEAQKQRLKGDVVSKYAKETFVVKSIADATAFYQAVKK